MSRENKIRAWGLKIVASLDVVVNDEIYFIFIGLNEQIKLIYGCRISTHVILEHILCVLNEVVVRKILVSILNSMDISLALALSWPSKPWPD